MARDGSNSCNGQPLADMRTQLTMQHAAPTASGKSLAALGRRREASAEPAENVGSG